MALISRTHTCACCSDGQGGNQDTHFDRRHFLRLGAGAGLAATFPTFSFGATGKYEAMLLTCIDPRFPERTIRYMERRHLAGKYSQFTFAGAAIGVVAPAFRDWEKTFWDNLAASIKLHNISRVIAMNHRDCSAAEIAYGKDKVINSRIETETHRAALMEFRRQVGERHPTLAVETGLMSLNGRVEMFS